MHLYYLMASGNPFLANFSIISLIFLRKIW